MKRIIVLMLMLMLPIMLLSGCSAASEKIPDDRFYFIRYTDSYIYVDKETRVMYFYLDGDDGCLSVMLDAEGNPLLYEGEIYEN